MWFNNERKDMQTVTVTNVQTLGLSFPHPHKVDYIEIGLITWE